MTDKKNMLDVVIARAEQSSSDKTRTLKLKTEALGDIIVNVPPLKKLTDWLDEFKPDEMNTWEMMLANAELIFNYTPFLKENFNQLSEAYEEKDPSELTIKIFEAAGCIGELNDIADRITSSIGADKTAIKN